MSSTALKTEEEKKEYFDPPDELEEKVAQLAEWIQEAEYFTAFTGAGISTSAGIADYRSGYDTVLPTGPGCWEKKAAGKTPAKPKIHTEMIKAIPTPTHMSLVKLMEVGKLKYLVSQNIDGLHRRSGINPNQLAEVHGNYNLEICKKCKKEYMRDFRVRTAQKTHDHETGRFCEDNNCKGSLIDSIINFGENLTEKILDDAFENSAKSDLCLAMGSSLTVTPAADIPRNTSKVGRLIIVNLQKTPLDRIAAIKINAFCDTVMQMLMEKLGLEIPEFKLVRRLRITKKIEVNSAVKDGLKNEAKIGAKAGIKAGAKIGAKIGAKVGAKVAGGPKSSLEFQGIDSDGCPFTLFTSILVKKGKNIKELKKNPLKLLEDRIDGVYEVTLNWQGHYQEPPLVIQLQTEGLEVITYTMVFDPRLRTWESISTV